MQPTYGTALSIGPQHPCPEDRLMESGACEPFDVGPLRRPEGGQVDEPLALVHGDGELQSGGVFVDHPDRIPRDVDTPSDSDEVGQCSAVNQGITKCSVVRVLGIGSPVLVANQAVGANIIFVMRRLIGWSKGGADGNGRIQARWLPDPRLDDEADSPPIECEGVDVLGGEGTIRAGGEQAIEMAEHLYPESGVNRVGYSHHTDVVSRRFQRGPDESFLSRRWPYTTSMGERRFVCGGEIYGRKKWRSHHCRVGQGRLRPAERSNSGGPPRICQ